VLFLCRDGVAVFVLVLWHASLNSFAGSHDFIPIDLSVFDMMRSAFSILADLHHLATILKIQCYAYKGFVKNKVARFQEFFSEIATFKLQVPAGHQNIAGFLKFSTFLSDL
jgi:hypothetical protein